jgi:hypothetical protein
MLFLGDHNVLVLVGKSTGGARRQERFWPERGLIHCEDSEDDSYRSMTVRTFLQRVRAHCDMLGRKGSRSDTGADSALRTEVLRLTERAIEIAEIAKEQGMPSDASARRDLVRRRAKTIAVTDRRAVL